MAILHTEIIRHHQTQRDETRRHALPVLGISTEPRHRRYQQNVLIITVEETDSIREVKQDIKARVAEADEPLFYNGVELADEDATLLEYNIAGSRVPDHCPGGPLIHLGGAPWRSFDLEPEHVTAETTVAQLKGRITSEVGIPYLCMKLFAGPVELRDPLPLQRYGLAGDSAVQVMTTRSLYTGPAA
ncbi:unnamed protein product [Cladocopium goreaui]|uniref:Ubiquitin-like domain-containing protein n=1 Tax=Cladocopium goreaui TaxID=2562237 RepID=A0A9P1FN68_9DINO|nr:unnamed protein product [Cladocopium goreaui]